MPPLLSFTDCKRSAVVSLLLRAVNWGLEADFKPDELRFAFDIFDNDFLGDDEGLGSNVRCTVPSQIIANTASLSGLARTESLK
jgi:hypothetical protein